VHNRDDEHSARFVEIEQGVRKHIGKVPADGRIKQPKTLGLPPDVEDEAFDFVIEPPAQRRIDPGVILSRHDIFLIRPGMKGAELHRPTIRRT